MAYRSFVKEFSKQQLIDMSPNGRMDCSPGAEFKAITGFFRGTQATADRFITGSRTIIELMESILHQSYSNLVEIGLITGYYIIIIPINHSGKDAIIPPRGFGLMFPFSEEIVERLAELP